MAKGIKMTCFFCKGEFRTWRRDHIACSKCRPLEKHWNRTLQRLMKATTLEEARRLAKNMAEEKGPMSRDPWDGWLTSYGTPPKCLKCGKEFYSEGPHDRLCPACEAENSDLYMSGSLELPFGGFV